MAGKVGEFSLANKVAVVTGGGSGCHVIIGDIRLVEESESWLQSTKDEPSKALFQKTDVINWDDLKALINRAHQEFGKTPDLVLNEVDHGLPGPSSRRSVLRIRERIYTFKLVSLMFVKHLCKNPGIVELLFKANLPATIAKLAACNFLTGRDVASGRSYLDRETSGVEWFSATFARKLQRLVLVFDNSVLYSKIIVDRVRIHKDSRFSSRLKDHANA